MVCVEEKNMDAALTHWLHAARHIPNLRGATMSAEVPEEPDPERLAALEKRLSQLKKAEVEAKPAADVNLRMADMAWRMVIELVAGLGIGFGIGIGLDAVFGTKPFLMLIFVFLGLAAGVKVMLRSAQDMAKAQAALQAAGKEGK